MAHFSDPLRLALASLACAALVAAPVPPVVRAAGALPLVLYLPGRCFLAAVFPDRRIDGEMRVLSAALSLALVILLGLGLACVNALGSRAWLAGLATLCVASCIAAAAAGRGSQTPAEPAAHPRLESLRLLSLLVAAGLAGFAYLNASRGALEQRPDLYTDFWIVPGFGQAPAVATAGVKNQEGRDAVYAIDVVARGATVARLADFRLPVGELRTIQVALPRMVFTPAATRPWEGADERPQAIRPRPPETVLGDNRVELRLFKDGNRDAAYRRVWIALPASIAVPADLQEAALPAGDLSYSGSALRTLRASLRAERAAGSEASPRDPIQTPSTVRDTTHALDLSQAAALQAPAYNADPHAFGVAPDDAAGGLRSSRFAPGPTANATTPTSPD